MAITDPEVRKRRRVRLLQRFILNPPVLLAVRAGLMRGYVLVETTGRRSAKKRRTVVGMQIEGATGFVVAEQGRHASYVRNLEAAPEVRVYLRRRWHPAQAWLLPHDDVDARLASFAKRGHASTVRRLGTDLCTIRFDLEAPP